MMYDVNGNAVGAVYDINGNAVGEAYDIDGDAVGTIKGAVNAVMSCDLLTETRWTPVLGTMPRSPNGLYSADIMQTGMPYSSASKEDGYIQTAISLYTFMCAVKNPKSVLYTQESKGYTGSAYYGTVCTSLVGAAWGLPFIVTTEAVPKADFLTQVNFSDVKVGDMLCGDGHALLVIDVEYDENDFPTRVRTSESVRANCRKNNFVSYATFTNTTKLLYRYNHIDDIESFYNSPFPKWEGKIPDIMTNFGDKITRKYGTDVEVNIINSANYGRIEVYKDGVLTETKNTIADFTMVQPAVGEYEVRMINSINPNRTSSTFFEIIGCTATISNNLITVHTDRCVLVGIGGYPIYRVDSNGKAIDWNNNKRVHLATNQEAQSGIVNIADMLADEDCDGGILVYVKGKYGTVSYEIPYATA